MIPSKREKKSALLSLIHHGAKDLHLLKEILKDLSSQIDIVRVSSIYEKDLQDQKHVENIPFLGQSLCLAMAVATEQECKTLHKTLKTLEETWNRKLDRSQILLELLCYEAETYMLPTLTIPHPAFHRRADYIMPSAEIWPNYEHPILEKTLKELQGASYIEGRLFFYAQGKLLLDF